MLVLKERKAEDGSQSLALLLTSGGFRTAETKAILNEALKPMALRVESNDSGAAPAISVLERLERSSAWAREDRLMTSGLK